MGTWQLDLASWEISCDSRCKALLGFPPDAAVTFDTFIASVHPEDRSIVHSWLQHTFEGDEDYEMEYRALSQDRGERWIRALGCCESSGPDGSKQIRGIFIDITEKKRAELTAFHLASLVQSSGYAIISNDLQGNITSWNHAAERLYGYHAEEAIGQPATILVAPGRESETAGTPDPVSQVEAPYSYETVHRRKDGTEAGVSLTVSPVYDQAGRLIGVSTIAHDITERKRLDQDLRASEQRFRTLSEAAPDMLFSADSAGDITFMSARFQEYIGFSVGASGESTIWERILDPQDEAARADAWRESVLEGKAFQMECQIRRKDGVFRWFMVRALPVSDAALGVTQWLGSCTEIHHLKKIETALRHSNEELRQFAYAAAHDLQEPLRNVVNAAGMLSQTSGQHISGIGTVLVKECIEGGQRMHSMVKDLLAYTTVVEGIESARALTDSNEIMQEVTVNLKTAVAEASAKIQWEELPVVAVDRTHGIQLFQNLIGNALKYRRVGVPPVIQISAKRSKTDWLFAVADNGIGFDPKYKDSLFKVFKRLHKRHEYAGTGIGLAICARIIGHYGGRIWAEGRPGNGATFYFTIPAAENASDHSGRDTDQDINR